MLTPQIGHAKGPQYNLPQAIKSFLGQMAEGGIILGAAVIKELMQNADEAGATEMSILLDGRPIPAGLDDCYKRLALPALLVSNNAPFRSLAYYFMSPISYAKNVREKADSICLTLSPFTMMVR